MSGFQPVPTGSPPNTASPLQPARPTSPPTVTANSRRGPSVSSPLNPASAEQRQPLTREGSSGSSSGEHGTGTTGTQRSSVPHSRRESGQLDPTAYGWAAASQFGPFPARNSTSYDAFGRSASVSSNLPATPATGGQGGSFVEGMRSDSSIGQRDSLLANQMPSVPYRYSTASSINSMGGVGGPFSPPGRLSGYGVYSGMDSPTGGRPYEVNASLLWDKENAEPDDYLHEPNPELDRRLDRQWGSGFNARGIFNVGMLTIVICVIVGVFAFWPIYTYVIAGRFPNNQISNMGWNLGGINGSGQVPDIPGLPSLIDKDTPASVMTRTGYDGEQYQLVFSDEFNVDGRTFWPGDDPFWEAVDLHYWGTTDLEWYDPDAVVTRGGKMVITLSQEPINNLNFRSGMVQSWNKFCFTGGYLEVSASLPGTPRAMGNWPGIWTHGNLMRPGYGASTHGVWPYSYSTCDVGTLQNQTYPDRVTPTAARTSGDRDYGGTLSYLPGQRLSSCTCPGEDHPGPNVNVGRGGPEIDLLEGQVDSRGVGSASQSIQIAPITAGYAWRNESPYIRVWDESRTFQNPWHGSVNQESMSLYTLLDAVSYEDAAYQTFEVEYDPGPTGRITWGVNHGETWQLNANAMGPSPEVEIGQRIVSEEPMAIVLNLAISTKFQPPEWGKLTFPNHLYIDYVRLYQKPGSINVGCSPSNMPTAKYIDDHMEAYTNRDHIFWQDAGYTFPKNRLNGDC